MLRLFDAGEGLNLLQGGEVAVAFDAGVGVGRRVGVRRLLVRRLRASGVGRGVSRRLLLRRLRASGGLGVGLGVGSRQ